MASNKPYLADTWKNANASTIEALYDIANQAGVKNDSNTMSTFDLTEAIKKATGTSGNTYGGTIGNKTLNQYGYKVDKNGNITKMTTAEVGAATSPTVSTGGMNIPGTSFYVPATADGVDAHKLGTFNYENYLTGTDTLNSGFDNYVTQLQGGAGNANAALEEARSNALAGIKSTYDDSARNYYRLYRTQEKELPEQLSSIGATGGATESAALRLMNNYSDNLYKNETARNQDINGLNQDYNDAIAKNSMQVAQQIADAYLQKAQTLQDMQTDFAQSQKDVYSSYMQNVAAQAAAQKEAQAAALTARNNNVHANELKRQHEGYTTAHWTDGNGEYHYRITGKKKVGSGSGSGSGGGDDTPKPPEPTQSALYDYVYRTANSHANGRGDDGRTSGNVAALNYINNSSLITPTEKKQMAKELGLL